MLASFSTSAWAAKLISNPLREIAASSVRMGVKSVRLSNWNKSGARLHVLRIQIRTLASASIVLK
jgi:hypothetical protein